MCTPIPDTRCWLATTSQTRPQAHDWKLNSSRSPTHVTPQVAPLARTKIATFCYSPLGTATLRRHGRVELLNFQELEETLSRLESVDAVRVVNEGDRVAEVHILAAATKPPKQVVRDVQSLAMARYGANIDRRVISVVQLAAQSVEAQATSRPRLVDIRDQADGPRITVSVKLSWQTGEHTGTATGPIAASARPRLVGEAALDALDQMFVNLPPLVLDSIGIATVGMRRVAIAVVVGGTSQESEMAVGSAVAGEDESEAAVKAVLDALNRRLPTLSE